MLRRFVVLIVASLPLASAADVRVVEEIAAKVNGDIITRGELEEKRREIEQVLRAQGLSGVKLNDAVKKQAADALRDQIDQLLLVQKGKDLTINVDPEVTRFLAELQVQSKLSDPDKFHDWIREQTGMTFEDFKDQKKKELLARRVVGQEIGSRIAIPEPELQKYYDNHKGEFIRKEQVFLSQILISTENKTPEQAAAAEKKAKELVVRARKGEKFSDLVRQNSDDPETVKSGGSLPPYQRGLLQKQIEDVVFKEKKGYVTDPVKVPLGFVILRIDERYDAGQAGFEEVKDEIQSKLVEPKMEPRVREYLTRLRQDAFMEIKEGYADSGAAPGKQTHWQDIAQLRPQTTTKEEVAARHRRKRKRLLFVVPRGYWPTAPATAAPPASASSESTASAPVQK